MKRRIKMTRNNDQAVAMTRLNYPPGTRVELISMDNDPRPIESGTHGTVRVVDDMGTIHVEWDNGRRLGLIPGEDSFRKLTMEELSSEQDMGGIGCQTM